MVVFRGVDYEWRQSRRVARRVTADGLTAVVVRCRIVLLAGDVFPIDVISHMPVVLEESDIPYCYVPSKKVPTGGLFVVFNASYSWSDVETSATSIFVR